MNPILLCDNYQVTIDLINIEMINDFESLQVDENIIE